MSGFDGEISLSVVVQRLKRLFERSQKAGNKGALLSAWKSVIGEVSPVWSQSYTWTCISALITSFMIAMLALPVFAVPPSTSGQSAVFVVAFGYGWEINDAYNKILTDWH